MRRRFKPPVSVPAVPPEVVPGVVERPLGLLLLGVAVKLSDTRGAPNIAAGKVYYFWSCRFYIASLFSTLTESVFLM